MRYMSSAQSVGIMALAALGFGLFQGARLLDLNSGPYSAAPFAISGIAAGGVAYLLAALFSYLGRLEDARPLIPAGIVCAFASMFIPTQFSGDGVAALSQILGGIGWALVNLCWMQLFSFLRPRWAMLLICIGYLIDSTLVPLALEFFSAARQQAFICAVVASWVLLGICRANRNLITEVAPDARESSRDSERGLRNRTLRALIGTAVFSAAVGFIVQRDIVSGIQYAQDCLTSLLCIGVSSVLCVAILLARPNRLNVDLVYPVLATLLASVLLYRHAAVDGARIAGSLMVALLITFFCLLWLAFVSEAHERQMPALLMLGAPVGVAQSAIAFGRMGALTSLGRSIGADETLMVSVVMWAAVVAACGLVVSFIACTYHRHGTASEPCLIPRVMGPELIEFEKHPDEAALLTVCRRYNLSDKEAETVAAYARGRSARYIADQHVISEHTVKTHLRRAYAKMGLHSRQELLDLIESVRCEAEAACTAGRP